MTKLTATPSRTDARLHTFVLVDDDLVAAQVIGLRFRVFNRWP
jgi:hypothetical protein